MPIITLTTDFGLDDAYVGIMKGVIAGICPRARVIDITHGIESGDVIAGAIALASSVAFFPRGTIHVAVVDPGVGSTRAALAIRTAEAVFVGPDNGVLSLATRSRRILGCRRIENARFCLKRISRTFHGRDIFAPVAAHLAGGAAFARVGSVHGHPVCVAWPEPSREPGRIQGEVVYVDRFGNAITNVPASWVTLERAKGCPMMRVRAGKRRRIPFGACYASVTPGRPVAVIGSSEFLEISINRGSAAANLGLSVGSAVEVSLK